MTGFYRVGDQVRLRCDRVMRGIEANGIGVVVEADARSGTIIAKFPNHPADMKRVFKDSPTDWWVAPMKPWWSLGMRLRGRYPASIACRTTIQALETALEHDGLGGVSSGKATLFDPASRREPHTVSFEALNLAYEPLPEGPYLESDTMPLTTPQVIGKLIDITTPIMFTAVAPSAVTTVKPSIAVPSLLGSMTANEVRNMNSIANGKAEQEPVTEEHEVLAGSMLERTIGGTRIVVKGTERFTKAVRMGGKREDLYEAMFFVSNVAGLEKVRFAIDKEAAVEVLCAKGDAAKAVEAVRMAARTWSVWVCS